MKKWRIIVSAETDPYMNMALDESLLRTYDFKRDMPVLRFYRWKNPAVSIGVAQKPTQALDLSSMRKNGIVFVRRMTGGEGIYHDDEVTYSIVCAKKDLHLPDSVRGSFRILTSFIIDCYNKLGLTAYFAGDKKKYLHGRDSSFCFATKEHFDIVVEGKKLGGNSQKRVNDLVFQHGSIPLTLDFPMIETYFRGNFSNIEKQTISLTKACNRDIEAKEIIEKLKSSFIKKFAAKTIKSDFTAHELDLAHTLCQEKYMTEEWNYFRRTRIKKKEEK